MKVLLVNKFHFRKGGSETYYFTLAQALERKGHQVVFFAMQDEKNLPCDQEQYFVSHASVGGGLKSKLNMVLHIAYSKEAYRNMKKLLETEKPDLVILNLVHKQITLSILDAIREYDTRLPVFWTMHDLIGVCPAYTMLDGQGNVCEKCLESGSFRPCVENRCIRGSRLMSMLSWYEAEYIRKKKWYHQVDLFICPSDFLREKLQAGRFTESPIVTMRNPLPMDVECKVSGEDEGYVLYFGRLSAEKGVDTLIDVAKKAGFRLLILGTGPMEAELKARAGDAPHIEFLGFRTGKELEDCVKRSRCVVLPSQCYENGPYSAMEAMAAGKPLVVSSLGGLPELVEDGVTGYVYGTEAENLAQCIERVLTLSPEEYETMSAASVRKAQELFNAERYVEQLMKWYLKVRK